jgi:hypothetical protein
MWSPPCNNRGAVFSVHGPWREDKREYGNGNWLHLSSEVPREQQCGQKETRKTVCDVTYAIVTAILRVWELNVVTTSEEPVTRFTNQNPRLSHWSTWQYFGNILLWRVEPLLGSGLETDNKTTFAARQQSFNKQVYVAVAGWRLRGQARSHGWLGQHWNRVFSTWSVPRGYKQRRGLEIRKRLKLGGGQAYDRSND